MMDAVVFDPVRFKLRYPQFASSPDEQIAMFFGDASMFVNNGPTSRVSDTTERERLLWLLTAHLMQLEGVGSTGGQGSTAGQVGRIASASEGSVSASFDNGAAVGSAQWYAQTQYGNTYWAATSKYRRFRYVPPCR